MEFILVGVKLPQTAGPALRWAAHYANRARMGVRLVHVVDSALASHAELRRDAYAYAENALEAAADVVSSGGVSAVERIIAEGDPAEQLHALARKAAMIVVASDGRHARGHRGVHALRLASGAPVPVIVVPETDFAQRRGVIVGVDASAEESDVVRFATACAVELGEPLTLVHAWQLPFVAGYEYEHPVAIVESLGVDTLRAVRALAAGIHERNPELELIETVVRGEPSDVLLEAASQAKLLVVGSHDRSPLGRLLLGSVSHGVLVNLAAPTAIAR